MGSLAAVFYAVQMLSGIYRNKRDFHDTAYGGMAAGALLGVSCKGQIALFSLGARSLHGTAYGGMATAALLGFSCEGHLICLSGAQCPYHTSPRAWPPAAPLRF